MGSQRRPPDGDWEWDGRLSGRSEMGAESGRMSRNHSCNLVKRKCASGRLTWKEVVKVIPAEGKTRAKEAFQVITAWPEI